MTNSQLQQLMGKRVHSFALFNCLRPIDRASRVRRFQCIKYKGWHSRTYPDGIQGIGTVNQRGGF